MDRMKWMAAGFTFTIVALFAPLYGAEVEQRFFRIDAAGKPAGELLMKIATQDSGGHVVEVRASRSARLLAGTWRSGCHAIETWKAGRLQKFDAAIDTDGKKRTISAAPKEGKLRVLINDKRQDARLDVWTTSFWTLPANVARQQSVALFDVHTGAERAGQLEYIGVETLTAAQQQLTAAHYRLRGEGIRADLWYDGLDRLVRAIVSEGDQTWSLELTGVARNKENANGKRE